MLQSVAMGSLDPDVDKAASKSYLEKLVKRKMAETLTLDAQTHCSQFGDLKSNAEQLVILPLGLGCWGSIGAMLKPTDEVLRMLQSVDRLYQRDMITILGNDAEVVQTLAFNKPHGHYRTGHIYFGTHSFGSR